jgi:flagellin
MLSIQTNINSLIAQNNLRINENFQQNTITQLTSGYRINSSGDDAAGLAVANTYRDNIAQLTQGVLNANQGLASLQIVDGGLSNISTILDRLQTLATESASGTFTGDRNTLNNEFQTDLQEITRQASNIGLVAGGTNNTNLQVFIGGGNITANSNVAINLSGATNRVDAASLGLGNVSVAGGGVSVGNSNLNGSTTYLTGGTESFTFNLFDTTMLNTAQVAVTVSGGTGGITGAAALTQLNNTLSAYGISATTDASGNLAFGGTRAFSVTTGASASGLATAAAGVQNTGVYNFTSGAGIVSQDVAQTLTFQNANGTALVTLANGATLAQSLASINAQTQSLGIYAVTGETGSVSLQSQDTFSVTASSTATSGVMGGASSISITAPDTSASVTGNAQAALNLVTTAVTNLGLVQGTVGAGENLLNYAINLAQSQITNFSATESQIRDADVAAEAANLTKAQVLQQAGIAAMAQANSAPQAVLALLR